MTEPRYVSFECAHVQGPADLDPVEQEGALACAAIDGYPSDENAPGTVICNVWLTTERKPIVDWHHDGYRLDPAVLEEVSAAKAMLLEAYPA